MKGAVKKILIGIGVLFALLIVAAVAIPLFVDVDKYRPQIERAANDNLNGKLELGKLSLSLWGQVRIEIGGLKLTDRDGRQVVAVNDAFFHLPFSSILSGSPQIVLNMNKPALNVVKDKYGKMNVMTLVKSKEEKTAQAPTGTTAPSTTGGAPSGNVTLPGMATRARIGVEVHDALLTYKDELSGLDTTVKDLNLVMRDVSLSRETQMELSANLDTQMKESGLVVRGPAKLIAKARPTITDGKFDHVDMDARADLDQLEIVKGTLFHKKPGMDAHADIKLTASPAEARIDQMKIKFFNAEVDGKGTITHLNETAPAAAPGQPAKPAPAPVVNFTMKSNKIDFKPWNELVPMLKEYDLGGSAQLDAEANGPSDKLSYKANFVLDALTAKAPNLKAQPRFDGVVKISTDQVENMNLKMTAPGNQLEVQGKVVSFTAPKIDLRVTSTGMDLDQLIAFPPPGSKTTAAPAAHTTGTAASGGGASGGGTGSGAPAADYDAMMATVRENKILQQTTANVSLNLKSLKAYNVAMSDITGRLTMADLLANIESFGMKIFGGSIRANAALQMKSKIPSYKFSTNVDQLDLQQAVNSQVQFLKNTLIGKAGLEMSAEGASFNTPVALDHLKGKGRLRVTNAKFASIDVGKMVSEALNGAIEKVGDKVPGLKGKKIGGLPNGESRYESITTDFTIENGKFLAPNFFAKAEPKAGIDIKGDTTVGLKDFSLKTNWEVIDTYNLTRARDLSIDQAGVKVDHILAQGNDPVKFPISVGCTLTAPCYSYTQVPEALAKVALNNLTGSVKGKAKAEVQKKAEELLKKNAPPAVQDQLKKLFGR